MNDYNNDDYDDRTVFQTDEDKKKLEKEILSGQYDDNSEYDTTIKIQ